MKKKYYIFQNEINGRTVKSAEKKREGFKKKFGDDSEKVYHLAMEDQPVLKDLGTKNLVLSDQPLALPEGSRPIVIGNIRMGFGHYRISMAMCSAARALGYDPLWLDLNSFPETTMTKVISYQNDLYSLGSRISAKSALFNKLVWEPLNYEGFRKLSQNVNDQLASELMTPIFRDIDKDIPYIATHVWPAQAAVHSGMKHVVNAIPDNWQMGLHLAEGSIHTIQTYNSYLGYRNLRGMDKKRTLHPMGKKDLYYTGHYIDHELVSNIEKDCEARKKRAREGRPVRYLLTVGGAGSQMDLFCDIIRYLLPQIRKGRALLFINVGDHKNVYEELEKRIPALKGSHKCFCDYEGVKKIAEKLENRDEAGIYSFYDSDIFSAVYTTNLLMRVSDVLVTKPSELAFYPIPKLFIKRVGGHEKWGAIHSAELGDGTYECVTKEEVHQMIRLFQKDPHIMEQMCDAIVNNKSIGIYDGAYEAVKLAVGARH